MLLAQIGNVEIGGLYVRANGCRLPPLFRARSTSLGASPAYGEPFPGQLCRFRGGLEQAAVVARRENGCWVIADETPLKDLNYELKQLCQRNCDGSYATRYARERILTMVANQLHGMGFRHMSAASLKPKHVEALVERWKADALSAGTIKNRMSELRWWAEKIHKQNMIARDNAQYDIPRRQYVTNVSQSRELTTGDLAKVTDPYTALSLKLQAAFGLRREESIKIMPDWADRVDLLVLKASWTKGGRQREIPIRTEHQRQLLDEAKALAGRGSLIPSAMSYVQQLQRFKAQCREAGIQHVHGHRHQYAQTRYQSLTG